MSSAEEQHSKGGITGTVHLVRHGEVENPKGIIYGRLPGYNLSERGQRQAAGAARRLADADAGAIWSSPLERAQETATAIAIHHAMEVTIDERITESDSTLEGVSGAVWTLLRNPVRWWRFRNPMRPSWGEPFSSIRARMVAAITDALAQAGGREVVIVSHQTPVLVARLALAKRRVPPWLGRLPCATGSVTTLVLDEGRVLTASYFRPDE